MAPTELTAKVPWPLKLGLGCVVVVIAVVGAMVALNWDRIQSAKRSSVETLSKLQSVRAAVQKQYDTPDVGVFTKTRMRRPEGLDLPDHILSVELLNPPFLEGSSEEELETKARETAEIARNAHPSPEEFDAYDIIFTERTGVFFTVGSRRHFVIPAEALAAGDEAR